VQSSNIDVGFDAAQGAKCQINRMLLDRAEVEPNTAYRIVTTAALLDTPQSVQALKNVTIAFRSAFDGVIDAIGEAIATATPVGTTIGAGAGVRQSKGSPLNRSCRRTCLPGTGMPGEIAAEARLESWALQCVLCEPGTYSRGGVEAACVPCAPGLFQSERGQFGCISCDIGDFFQEREQQSFCVPCPTNTQRYLGVLGAANRTACQCKQGYFHPKGEAGEPCEKCPPASVCNGRLELPRRQADDLNLAVLLPTWNSWPEGRASIGAIALAVDFVNNQTDLLGGKKVVYSWQAIDCNPSQAIASLTRMLEERPVDAVIGPDCSVACESTAYLTSGRDIPQISYSCSADSLSDRAKFPSVSSGFFFVAPRALGWKGVSGGASPCMPAGDICAAVCALVFELLDLGTRGGGPRDLG
jgi:hypothetical protein